MNDAAKNAEKLGGPPGSGPASRGGEVSNEPVFVTIVVKGLLP